MLYEQGKLFEGIVHHLQLKGEQEAADRILSAYNAKNGSASLLQFWPAEALAKSLISEAEAAAIVWGCAMERYGTDCPDLHVASLLDECNLPKLADLMETDPVAFYVLRVEGLITLFGTRSLAYREKKKTSRRGLAASALQLNSKSELS